MPEKSALPATSLPMGTRLFPSRESSHNAGASVQLDLVAVLQPAGDAADGHDGRDAHLTGNNGRVREEAAALNPQTRRTGEEHDPAWVGPFGYKDVAHPQAGVARIGDDTYRPAHNSRTAAQALSLVAVELLLRRVAP